MLRRHMTSFGVKLPNKWRKEILMLFFSYLTFDLRNNIGTVIELKCFLSRKTISEISLNG